MFAFVTLEKLSTDVILKVAKLIKIFLVTQFNRHEAEHSNKKPSSKLLATFNKFKTSSIWIFTYVGVVGAEIFIAMVMWLIYLGTR